jgi:hypothetical protein
VINATLSLKAFHSIGFLILLYNRWSMKFKGFSEGFSNRLEVVKELIFFWPRPFQAGPFKMALFDVAPAGCDRRVDIPERSVIKDNRRMRSETDLADGMMVLNRGQFRFFYIGFFSCRNGSALLGQNA